MNKKGFTLVELLAVIVILALLALITGTAVTKLISDSKEDLSNAQIQLIKSSAESWAANNLMDIPDVGECLYLTLGDLKKYGFIDSSITNPKTNKEFSDDLKIKISSTLSEYNATVTAFEVDPTSVQGCRHFEQEPGLYDSNDNLLASWDVLIKYGLDIEKNYDSLSSPGSFNYIVENYDDLKEGTKLIISSTVTKIGHAAFLFNNTLTTVIIPSSVESISYQAFFGCPKLTNIILPIGLTTIESETFFGCSSLESITIPSSVTSIGENAFYGCSSLKNIYYSGSASGSPWGATSATIIK